MLARAMPTAMCVPWPASLLQLLARQLYNRSHVSLQPGLACFGGTGLQQYSLAMLAPSISQLAFQRRMFLLQAPGVAA